MKQESTEDLLRSYGSGSGSWFPSMKQYGGGDNDDNEDLSIYSISNETYHQRRDLSELYNLLEDDSIEIKRSTTTTLESPKFKFTSSPEKPHLVSSPTKKLRNDYQDYVGKMRLTSTSTSNSPIKRKRQPSHNAFDINDSIQDTHSFNSFDEQIDRYLEEENDIEKKRIQRSRKQLFDLNETDQDKTELIIRETHRLVNDLPVNIMNGNGQSMLKSSIKQLVNSLQTLKNEKNILQQNYTSIKSKYELIDHKYSKLEDSNSRLEVENARLQSELNQMNRKLNEKITKESSSSTTSPSFSSQQALKLQKANDLMRTKLRKYKDLYLKSLEKPEQSNKGTSTIATPNGAGQEDQDNEEDDDDDDDDKIVNLKDLQKVLSTLMDERIQQLEMKKQGEKQVQLEDKSRDTTTPQEVTALFERLVLELQQINQSKLQPRPQPQSQPQPQPQSQPQSQSQSQSNIDMENDSDKIKIRLIEMLQSNNKALHDFSRLFDVFPKQDNHRNIKLITPDNSILENNNNSINQNQSPILVKCYICHESQEPITKSPLLNSNENKAIPKKPRKGICKRCATINSESSQEVLDNDTNNSNNENNENNNNGQTKKKKSNNTINMMGEYKWSI